MTEVQATLFLAGSILMGLGALGAAIGRFQYAFYALPWQQQLVARRTSCKTM
jgi:hypothetical protein